MSQVLTSLIQFQETYFGKNARKPPTMRLPMRCFLDFEPGGNICCIFSCMFCNKTGKGWEHFKTRVDDAKKKTQRDAQLDTRLDIKSSIELATKIRQSLLDKHFLQLPIAYIRPEVGEKVRERITDILRDCKCELTSDEDQASHIIYPETDPLPDEYARPSFKSGKNVMIHWYYLPESYESWVPNTFDLPVRLIF